VRFSLDWALDPKVKPSIQQLEQLGAMGLVQRYRLLEQQGVAL
jgi:type IV pilus assembly protein PilN